MVSDKKIFKVFYIAIKPYPLTAIFFFLRNHDTLKQEDHDGPISLTWPNRFAYLLLKFQPSSLL